MAFEGMVSDKARPDGGEDAYEAIWNETSFAKSIIETAQIIVLVLDLKGRIISFNPYMERISGFAIEEVRGKDWFETFLLEEGKENIKEIFSRSIAGTRTSGNVNSIVTKSGEVVEIEWYDNALKDENGHIAGLISIGYDITQRLRAEEELKRQSDLAQKIMDTMGEGLLITAFSKGSFALRYANPAFSKMIGIPAEDLVGKSLEDLILEEDLPYLVQAKSSRIVGETTSYEVRLKRPDEERVYVHMTGSPFYHGNAVVGSIVVVTDLTKLHSAQRQIKESRELLEGVIDGIQDVIGVQYADHTILRYNKAGYDFSGKSPEEVAGKKCYELMGWSRECDLCATRLALKSKKPEAIEKHIPELGRYLDCRSNPILDEEGNVKLIVEQLRDVTEVKLYEKALKESESRYRTLFETSPLGIGIIEIDGRISGINPAMLSLMGIDSPSSAKEINVIKSPLAVRSGISQSIRRCIDLGSDVLSEHIYTSRCGKDLYIRVNLTPMRDASGQIAKIQCIVEDITDHKKAEEILRQSLHEKEVLLKEIHHRVKNNLQIVSSLLNLQSGCLTDEVAINAIKESQNRIRSMALVHENLYRSDSLARVDFKEYMNSLICFLMTSFGKKSSHIGLKLDLDQVFLSVDQAIPCGLIANELISNCVKHAFPGGIKGQIHICLKSLDGGMVSFSVRDNGIGLPSGWKISGTETMGLKLVTALINQLKGTIDVISSHEVDGSHGSEFKISFDAQH